MRRADPRSPAQAEVLRAAGDLEECLKTLSPKELDGQGRSSLRDLVDQHADRFSDFASLTEARLIRNWIVHRDRLVTDSEAERAIVSFDRAVQEVLPDCPEPLKRKFAL